MAEQVYVNPEVLQQVYRQFLRCEEVIRRRLNEIRHELSTLKTSGPEGWIGDAANQHFAEMEQYVLPNTSA
jgi:uncharacterized protein YukE